MNANDRDGSWREGQVSSSQDFIDGLQENPDYI
jgi:hypothetical protein